MQGYLWIIWVKLAGALWIIGGEIRQLINILFCGYQRRSEIRHIYMYMYVCVCVCIYRYVYICIYHYISLLIYHYIYYITVIKLMKN
jgi:hypothetical protein